MAQLVISGKELIRLLEKLGFEVIRINGSHHRIKHPDGRVTTVPVIRLEIMITMINPNSIYMNKIG
ncbi:type II toxin-antitoxin system HicA family toxin [Runella sp.]|uniref:type II toxin-antitoxin system HicA family toxin n=1 Tax=Runella sp. TaxID=1960881 RepID=UPI003D13CF41